MTSGTQSAQARGAPKGDFLPSLNGGRAIAAFLVFGGHYLAMQFATPVGVERYAAGAHRGATDEFFFRAFEAFIPVPINYFFVLSGFVLAWIYKPGMSATGFWIRRFGRIYPAYLITTAIAFVLFGLLSGFWTPWKVVLTHVFVLQAWTPDQRYNLALNAIMWTLSAEAFNYLLFPALMIVFLQMSKRALHVVGAACIVGSFLIPWMVTRTFDMRAPGPPVIAPLEGFDNQFAYWFVNFFPPMRALQFTLGIVLALLIKRGVRWFAPNMPVALLIVAGGLWLTNSVMPIEIRYDAGMLIPLTVFSAALVRADMSGKRTLLKSRPMLFLGRISYAFYAVHILFILFTTIYPPAKSGATDRPRIWLHAMGFLDKPTDAVPGWLNVVFLLTYLGVAIFAAWLLHAFVEEPISRTLRRRVRQTKRPQNGGAGDAGAAAAAVEAPALAVPGAGPAPGAGTTGTGTDPNGQAGPRNEPAGR